LLRQAVPLKRSIGTINISVATGVMIMIGDGVVARMFDGRRTGIVIVVMTTTIITGTAAMVTMAGMVATVVSTS
jgi:hypothetical protein